MKGIVLLIIFFKYFFLRNQHLSKQSLISNYVIGPPAQGFARHLEFPEVQILPN